MARLRLEYKSEPEKGEPFIKAEGYIEVMYNSELEEMKAKLLALNTVFTTDYYSIFYR